MYLHMNYISVVIVHLFIYFVIFIAYKLQGVMC